MKGYVFDRMMLRGKSLSPAYVDIDDHGVVLRAEKTPSDKNLDYEQVKGILTPGFQNAHSHAFQYAMGGLAENLPTGKADDDFWSWREEMYKLALSIDPDKMQDVATKLYKEMVRVGYTHVAEFHYLHHDRNGKPYDNLAEMSERLMIAAGEAGIDITVIPMFYQQGGFGSSHTDNQRRFISNTIQDYFKLYDAVQETCKNYTNASYGVGVHSLRAVKPEDVIETFKLAAKKVPKHIHISEQMAEVEDCLKFHKKRPVEWLLENVEVDETYNLVHATHITEKELIGIVKAQANIVLCPSTEANLGDGLFPLSNYIRRGGHWSIGTDSHVGLSPMEELRWLDYGQRLTQRKRNPLCVEGEDSGEKLYFQSLISGRRAMGFENRDFFKEGKVLEGVVVDSEAPSIKGKDPNKIMSALIFASDSSVFLGTLKKGKWVYQRK